MTIANKESAWCKNAGCYYFTEGEYNKGSYDAKELDGYTIVDIMGLPATRAFVLGIDRVKREAECNPRKIAKLKAKEDSYLYHILEEAYKFGDD